MRARGMQPFAWHVPMHELEKQSELAQIMCILLDFPSFMCCVPHQYVKVCIADTCADPWSPWIMQGPLLHMKWKQRHSNRCKTGAAAVLSVKAITGVQGAEAS